MAPPAGYVYVEVLTKIRIHILNNPNSSDAKGRGVQIAHPSKIFFFKFTNPYAETYYLCLVKRSVVAVFLRKIP